MQRQLIKKSFSSNKCSDSGNDRKKSFHNDSSFNHKNDEDLHDVVHQLQFKILKKNEHLTKMKEEVIELQVQQQEEKRNWQNEKCALERQADFYKENVHTERLNNQTLLIQIEKLTQMLTDLSKIKQHFDTNITLEKVSGQLNQEIYILQKEIGTLKTQITLQENKLLTKEEIFLNNNKLEFKNKKRKWINNYKFLVRRKND